MNRLPTTYNSPWKFNGLDIGRNLFLADSVFDGIGEFFKDVKFPKYNVIRKGDDMEIEIALAGYAKDDIDIELTNENVLTVSSGEDEDRVVEDEDELGYTYVHRGVASRNFKISWKVSATHDVGKISYDNGMLRIPLKSKAPDKPKTKILQIE